MAITIGTTNPNNVIMTGGATVLKATCEAPTETLALAIFTKSTIPIGKSIPAINPAIINPIILFIPILILKTPKILKKMKNFHLKLIKNKICSLINYSVKKF